MTKDWISTVPIRNVVTELRNWRNLSQINRLIAWDVTHSHVGGVAVTVWALMPLARRSGFCDGESSVGEREGSERLRVYFKPQ